MIDEILSVFEGKPIEFYTEKVHPLQYFEEPISEHIAGYLLIKSLNLLQRKLCKNEISLL